MQNLILILATLFITGCASIQDAHLYDGPALTPEHSTRLTLPLEFEITELDGRLVPIGQQRFRSDNLFIYLTPGKHHLVLHYESIWDIDGDNHETVRSQPILFEIDGQAGEQLVFSYESPTTLKQAQNFAQSIPVTLISDKQSITGYGLKKADPLTFNKKKPITKVDLPYLQQLQYWWDQATPYERREFKEWINQQDTP